MTAPGDGLQILRPKTGLSRDACKHPRTDFITFVKGKDNVRPTVTPENAMGAGVPLDTPSVSQERGKHP